MGNENLTWQVEKMVSYYANCDAQIIPFLKENSGDFSYLGLCTNHGDKEEGGELSKNHIAK